MADDANGLTSGKSLYPCSPFRLIHQLLLTLTVQDVQKLDGLSSSPQLKPTNHLQFIYCLSDANWTQK